MSNPVPDRFRSHPHGTCVASLTAAKLNQIHSALLTSTDSYDQLKKIRPHLTSVVYRDFLRDQLPNLIGDAVEDLPIAERRPLYYQLDGSGPHFGTITKIFLNENWPNRWIGRGGPIEWPAIAGPFPT